MASRAPPCKYFEIRTHFEGEGAVTKEEFEWFLREVGAEWIFQVEEGESGYKHFQGHMQTVKKTRKTTLIKLWEDKFGKGVGYIAPTAGVAERKFLSLPRYASNIVTRIAGPWKHSDREPFIPVQYRFDSLRAWQTVIMESGAWPVDRKVRIIYDRAGCSGKSSIASLIDILGKGFYLPQLHSFDEIMQYFYSVAKSTVNPGIVCFDMPRAFDQKVVKGIYAALEAIKNGWCYDKRYAGKRHWFNSPQVWVFCNELPAMRHLSADRWAFYKIEGDQLVECVVRVGPDGEPGLFPRENPAAGVGGSVCAR